MEGVSRTSTDINRSIAGRTKTNPLLNTGNIATTIVKNVVATHCVYSAVCDWNLILRSSDVAVPNQCFSMQGVLNS
jgi:hypothetical protein